MVTATASSTNGFGFNPTASGHGRAQCNSAVLCYPSQRWVAEAESYPEEPDVTMFALPSADDPGTATRLA